MNIAVNIRGTGGSGKSYIVHHMLGDNSKEVTLGPNRTPGYVTEQGIVVVGSYATKCGGLDRVKTQDQARAAVWAALEMGPVLFEGLLVSGIFKPWYDFSCLCREKGRGVFIWAYLQTPVPVCLERVYQRNGGKPIKEKHIWNKDKQVKSSRRKLRALGETVLDLDLDDPLQQIQTLFRRWRQQQ
jgi:hypothetical protein